MSISQNEPSSSSLAQALAHSKKVHFRQCAKEYSGILKSVIHNSVDIPPSAHQVMAVGVLTFQTHLESHLEGCSVEGELPLCHIVGLNLCCETDMKIKQVIWAFGTH